jgi:transcriptional/translational regulatory protein YebC/TACO1
VRQCFTKSKCKIGTQGVASHMFDHSAIFSFTHDDEEAILEALLMADIDVSDIESEGGKITVFAPQAEYFKAKQALIDTLGEIDFEIDEVQFLPQITKPISGEDLEMFEKFLDMLNDLDDVQNIYYDVEY